MMASLAYAMMAKKIQKSTLVSQGMKRFDAHILTKDFLLLHHFFSAMKRCTIVHLHSYIYLPQRCVPAMPCQFQVMDPDRVADCLPECDTLTRNSLLQLTDKIAFSCDYSSFQSILNCGNCLLALCEFENRFNPEAKACVVKYYNEIWPCYRTHFSE